MVCKILLLGPSGMCPGTWQSTSTVESRTQLAMHLKVYDFFSSLHGRDRRAWLKDPPSRLSVIEPPLLNVSLTQSCKPFLPMCMQKPLRVYRFLLQEYLCSDTSSLLYTTQNNSARHSLQLHVEVILVLPPQDIC